MSHRIRKFANTIKKLHKCNDKEKRRWLKLYLNKDFVDCACECAHNILKGKVPLTKTQRNSLIKRKSKLRQLVKRKTSIKKKKQIIQSGGFLSALLGPIVCVLGSLLGFNKSNNE